LTELRTIMTAGIAYCSAYENQVVDLLERVYTVSVVTMKIIKEMEFNG